MVQVIENEPCYIYHTSVYKETSLILNVLTLNHGAITIMVKGALLPHHPLRGVLQIFTPLLLTLSLSKGGFYFIKDCSMGQGGYSFTPPNIFCATYINELLKYLYQSKDVDKKLFMSYVATLEAVYDNNEVQLALRRFELQLFESMGYAITPFDDEGAKVKLGVSYKFCFGVGFVPFKAEWETHRQKALASLKSKNHSASSDNLLFAKSKVKGRKIKGTAHCASMGYEQKIYNIFSPHVVGSVELSQKLNEYASEFLGPILNGSEIYDILNDRFELKSSANLAKLLCSAMIERLLNGKVLTSRNLYREYMLLMRENERLAHEKVQINENIDSSLELEKTPQVEEKVYIENQDLYALEDIIDNNQVVCMSNNFIERNMYTLDEHTNNHETTLITTPAHKAKLAVAKSSSDIASLTYEDNILCAQNISKERVDEEKSIVREVPKAKDKSSMPLFGFLSQLEGENR